jgi:hypothetical protein
LHTAIIFPAVILQLYPNPVTSREMGLSYVTDDGDPSIGELDRLTNRKFRHLNSWTA